MMNTALFTPRMKLVDLIRANHNLILMLPRFGIPLGFGSKSVQEVCEQYCVPVDFLLLVCNVYTFDNYEPDAVQLVKTDMRLLVPYLQASHRYYLQERLPHIGRHLHNVAGKTDEKYAAVLEQFYADYQKEVQNHFAFEEKKLFPILQQIVSQTQSETKTTSSSSRSRTHALAESHGSIQDKLSDLTQIVYMYLPGNIMSEEAIEMVFDILQLSNDLEKHALIEERILIPYMDLKSQN